MDRGVLVEVVAHDHVRIALCRVSRPDGGERQRSGKVAIAVVHEDRADLAPGLEDAHRLADGLRIAVGHVEVVAPAVHGDDDGPSGQIARHLHAADLVLLPGLSALAPVRVHQRRIDGSPVRLDAGSDRRVRAVLAVERGETGVLQEVREPHDSGDGVPVGVDVAGRAAADGPQRDHACGGGDVAMTVVGNDEDVRRAQKPQLRKSGADAPQERVI
jgi:hypothetical protein